jgi:hypothetical protein
VRDRLRHGFTMTEPFAQELTHLRGPQWMADEIALQAITAVRLEKCELTGSFDALTRDNETERVRHENNGMRECPGVLTFDAVDKAAVNLQRIAWPRT